MAAVAVVLPTYNRAPVLARAIRSVLAQSFSDLELLVVDDGSEDGTAAVVASFDDPRVSYIRCRHTGSPSIARNVGIRASDAPLVAFQDSDDEWLVDKLARQIRALEAHGPGTILVCGGYLQHSARGAVSYLGADARMAAGDWDAGNIQDFRFIAPTWLIRREALEDIGLFDEEMANLEDWELAFRLHRRGVIIALDEPLVFKHGMGDGVNDRPESRVAALSRIIERHGGLWDSRPRARARLHRELGLWRALQGDIRAGRAEFSHALRLDPRSRKGWAHWTLSWAGAAAYRRAWSAWSRRQVAK